MTTEKQIQNLQQLNSNTVNSIDLSDFKKWLAQYLNIERVDVNLNDLDELPIACYISSNEDLTDLLTAEDVIAEIKEDLNLDLFSFDDVISYLIHKGELPLGKYEFYIDC